MKLAILTAAISTLFPAGIVATSMIVSAHADDAQCPVLVSATLNGQAALKPVQIAIYNNSELITSTTQHTFNIQLDCGKHYTATLTLGSVTRSRTFTTVGDGSNVIVAMD